MLQLSQLHQSTDEVIERLSIRNYDGQKTIEKVLAKDNLRKERQGDLDSLLARVNTTSKEIGHQ